MIRRPKKDYAVTAIGQEAAADGAPKNSASSVHAVPNRHYGRMASAAIVLWVGLGLLVSAIGNPNFQWDVVADYFTSSSILSGLWMTLKLTVVSMAIGVTLGLILALMRISGNSVLASVGWLYIWFFRGTPLLVQIIFWFNLAALYPVIGLGVPLGPSFIELNATQLITPFTAAVFALGLNEAAYMAEIVRAGLQSVDEGQNDAGLALGMRRRKVMRVVVIPQAMRVIIPPTGNQTIGMLKFTSLVSVIALPELLYSAQLIYSRTFETIPLLMVACIWYLIVTSILTVGQYYLERHYAKGSSRVLPPTPMEKIKGLLLRSGLARG